METIDVSAGIRPAPPPVPGKSVVLVPYYSAVEKECDEGLRGGPGRGPGPASLVLRHRSPAVRDALAGPARWFRQLPLHRLRYRLQRPRCTPAFGTARAGGGGDLHEEEFGAILRRVRRGGRPGRLRPRVAGPLSDALRVDRVPANPRRGPPPDDRHAEATPLPLGAVKGIYPFFLPLCVPDGRGGTRYLTEDYSFSHRLHQIGVTPMADTTIKLYHFGKYGFSFEDLGPRPNVVNCTIDIDYAEGEDRP